MTQIIKTLPTQAKDRIETVDILRGFAIFGILLFNMRSFAGQMNNVNTWDQTDHTILNLIDFLVQAKFYSLFSLLFGWGMAVQMRRAEEKGTKFFGIYLRRLLILFVFGSLHGVLLWTGDILRMYAVIGIFMLIFFRNASPKTLLIAIPILLFSSLPFMLPSENIANAREWCGSLSECLTPSTQLSPNLYATGTYWQITQLRFQEFIGNFWWLPCYIGNVFSMMLLGLYIGKRKLFLNAKEHLPLFRRVMWIGLIIGIIFSGLFVYISENPFESEYNTLARIGARTIGAPALMLFYVSGIILLFQKEKWIERLTPLSFVGRMALTNYLIHSIIWSFFFYGYGLGLYGETDPTFGLLLTIGIYLVQIRFSQWWFQNYKFGPFEWLWRTLTYGGKHPFSIKESYESIKIPKEKDPKKQMIFFGVIWSFFILWGFALFNWSEKLTESEKISPLVLALSGEIVPDTASTISEEEFIISTPIAEPSNIRLSERAKIGDLESIASAYNEENVQNHVEKIICFGGRAAGSESGHNTGEYIAEEFARAGLAPAGINGTFYQEFPLTYAKLNVIPTLSISGSDKEYIFHQDFSPLIGAYLGAGKGSGEVLWLNNCDRTDFAKIDVVDKVVFCKSGAAKEISRNAVENGAAALLLLSNAEANPPNAGTAILPIWIPEPIPAFRVYPTIAEDLLAGSGISLADLTLIFEPFALETEAELNISLTSPCVKDGCFGQNILGVFPGHDPNYADQVIIVGASYDSYGESPDKLKWEDDIVRAKGVAQLLEIAQSWKKQDYAPRVTVLFVGWDAGMQEILGEEYYENHPQYPSENILATLKLNVENDGETTSSILLGLAEGDFFIHDLLTHRANAVMDGDLDAFLATSLASERPNDKIWFEDAQALSPLAYEMDFNNLEMVGNEATAEVKIALEAAGENGGSRKISSSVPIKFAFIVDAWHWAGADLHWADAPKTGEEIEDIQDTELPPYFEVAHPVNKSLESLGELAGEKYTEIVQLFGLEEVDDGKLYLFATEEAMRANSAMSLPRGEKRFITENTIKTVYSSEFSEGEDFTTLLVELLLTNAGISENAAPWLWEGLPLVILANETPVNIQGRFLPKLEDSLESETQKAAISWAAVDYLQRQKGWRGLGNFIAALGRACDSTNCKTEDGANLALKSALGMDAESFETAWQADWESRLENAQDGIREVLSARNSAIRNGNSNAFLATVDSRTPNLINEEKSWFADLAEYPLEFLTYNGQPLAFYEDGSLLVSVTTEWQLEGITEKWGGGSSTFNIRFEKSGNAYRWAGVPLENLYGQKIRIRYPAGKEEIAQNFLENAEEIYTELATDLGINNRRTQIINLYNNKNAYRTSVFMSYPDPKWMQGWSAQNHSLKIMLEEGKNIESYRLALSTHLTRQLLAQRGVHAEWMLTGGSNYFARGVDNGASQMQAAEQLYYLNKAVESESVFDFNNFPPLYRLSESEYKIGLPQAWDFVRYLVENENAFWNAAQTGRARPELVSAWQTSFESGHATATQISIAEAFNEQGAIEHIEFLTASEMTGRQAGSAGADLAADYIAEKFEGYGLEVQRQVFPVYYQYYLETPSLDLNLSGVEEKYLYHEDFMLIQAVESALKGELVWVMDEDYVDMNLEGNIAIRKPTTDIATEIANATSHGAGALILVGDLNRERERSAKYLTPTALPEGSIPVLEFTRSGFKRLLENSGQSIASIYGAPPALFLDIEATLNISLNENRESETANIFGFLPGSDPVLSDEIIILSAHYDHVGDDPKTLYSGANDDASGLATMLEIAELWQENNYQPKRSVLFVAWGAQELGEGGSYYYLSNPLYPLENIVSVYQLDAVSGGDAHHLDAQGARDQEGLSLFYIEKAQEILGGRLQLSLPKEEGVPPFSPDALFARETIRVSSDHDPFREMGIQALRIAWREANETNPSDEFTDEVNPKFLSTAGRLTILTVMMDAR